MTRAYLRTTPPNLHPMVAELRDERIRRNLSQEDVSKLIGHKRPGTIGQYESGYRDNPGLKLLTKWANALGLEPTFERTSDADLQSDR